ncbi:LysR family transcriptional regulator [Burkholderia pseudomallei]|nr:LysR family transcriptional regulator [Burkholderia pseudomallei]
MEINAQFRDTTLSSTDFATVLNRLGNVIDSMAEKHHELGKNRWCLKGDSPAEATLYPAFDGNEPSSAALAVLKEEFRNAPNQTYVSIWDGNETTVAGVSMVCHIGRPGKLNSFAIEMVGEHGVCDFETITGTVTRAAQEFNPAYAEVSPAEYFEKRVFDDKPGVGWMLYLPKIITVQQVPEARALIPVRDASGKQTGTIIVSVTDAVFSADNSEHVEIANRIEIRLVDQDLLPRYADL